MSSVRNIFCLDVSYNTLASVLFREKHGVQLHFVKDYSGAWLGLQYGPWAIWGRSCCPIIVNKQQWSYVYYFHRSRQRLLKKTYRTFQIKNIRHHFLHRNLDLDSVTKSDASEAHKNQSGLISPFQHRLGRYLYLIHPDKQFSWLVVHCWLATVGCVGPAPLGGDKARPHWTPGTRCQFLGPVGPASGHTAQVSERADSAGSVASDPAAAEAAAGPYRRQPHCVLLQWLFFFQIVL